MNKRVTFLLSAIAVALVLAAGASDTFHFQVSYSPFAWIALASVCIIHLRVKWSAKDLLWLAAGMAALSALAFGLRGLEYNNKMLFGFAGLSSLAIMTVRLIQSQGEEKRDFLWLLLPSLLLIGQGWFAPLMLSYTVSAHPKTLDLYLYAFEGSLHLQPSKIFATAFAQWPILAVVSWVLYLAAPVPMALVYAEQFVRVKKRALPILLAILYSSFLGFIFYNVFPACGPKYLLQAGFPEHMLSYEQLGRMYLERVAVLGPRNAMPSLHLTWVLLAWFYSRGGNRWTRAVLMVFVVFTVIATLGTGEHYTIDLIVACPFLLLVQCVFAFGLPWNAPVRVWAFVVGLVATFGWLAGLRWGTNVFRASPIVPWTLAIGTVVCCLTVATGLSTSWEPLDRANEVSVDEGSAGIESKLRPVQAPTLG
jgi:hypothetical protein